MEPSEDYAIVERLRAARRTAVEAASAGRVRSVLGVDGDDPASRVYVVKLLDVHPALGKVAGRRLLADAGVAPFARVVDLTEAQKSTILRACGETT